MDPSAASSATSVFPSVYGAAAGNIQNCHGPWFAGTTKLPGWLKGGGTGQKGTESVLSLTAVHQA